MSHGEAGQRKELLVLDGEWRELPGERIPLDVGPRHFEVDGASAPAPSNIRAGDRFFARARVGLRPEQRAAQLTLTDEIFLSCSPHILYILI